MSSKQNFSNVSLLVVLICVATSLGCRSTHPLPIFPASSPSPAAISRDEGLHAQPANPSESPSYVPPVVLIDDQLAVQPVERESVPPNDVAALNQVVVAPAESKPQDLAEALPLALIPPQTTVVEQSTQPERAAEPATFALHIENVRLHSGAIKVAIFTDKATFLNPSAVSHSLVLPDTSAVATANISTDKPCAIAVFQDLDGDGQLTKNRSGLPTEPYGFSNNVMIKRGPPKFSDAVVVADAASTVPTQLRIRLTD